MDIFEFYLPVLAQHVVHVQHAERVQFIGQSKTPFTGNIRELADMHRILVLPNKFAFAFARETWSYDADGFREFADIPQIHIPALDTPVFQRETWEYQPHKASFPAMMSLSPSVSRRVRLRVVREG